MTSTYSDHYTHSCLAFDSFAVLTQRVDYAASFCAPPGPHAAHQGSFRAVQPIAVATVPAVAYSRPRRAAAHASGQRRRHAASPDRPRSTQCARSQAAPATCSGEVHARAVEHRQQAQEVVLVHLAGPRLSIRPNGRPPVHQAAHPPIRPSVRPSVCPSVHPFILPSFSPPARPQKGKL